MLELYIFNKENQTKNGLSRWDENDSAATTNLVSFNLDKFKVKDGSDNLCTELIGELNRLYKEIRIVIDNIGIIHADVNGNTNHIVVK